MKKIPLSPLPVRLIRALFHYWRYFLRSVAPVWRAFYFTRLAWRIPDRARKKHCYIVAGSGSGKSELLKVLILSHLKKRQRSETVFLLDPHGDIAGEVARFKEHRAGENLLYVSPDLDPAFTCCINPLEMGQGRNNPQQVAFMAECLTEVFKEIVGAETHITANMETLLKAVLSVLLQREGSTLLDLQRFMRDEENAELWEYATEHSTAGQRHFFTSAFYDKNYTATKNALYTKLQSLLNSETFYRLTIGKSTVDLQQAMDSKKTVVFNLAKGLIGQQTAPAFGRFIVGMIQGFSFARQTLPKAQRTPVFLYLDEFQNFITPSIETILAESRKYAVHLTLAQQFHGQGTNPALRGAILNNTAVKIAGRGEGASLKAIQEMMTGASKQDLQNLETGYFLLKLQSETILQTHLTENLAQPFRVTTSYLGNRHAMTPHQWQQVKNYQRDHYYTPILKRTSGDLSRANPESIESHLEHDKSPQNENFSPYRASKPVTPMFDL